MSRIQKWEYRVAFFSFSDNPDTLNNLGKAGWELVAVWLPENVYYFKRPLPDSKLNKSQSNEEHK